MREEITDGRLVLRRYRPEFVSLLFEAASESKGGEFTYWMPWCHENYSRKDSEDFVARTIESWNDGSVYGFAIFENDGSKIVGGIGLNQMNTLHGFTNLGYWVRTNKQNRGIATAAIELLARAAFEDLSINRIEILAAVENEASRRAADKAGAHFEGTLRKRLLIAGRVHDAAMFSFVRSDFD